MFLHAIMHEMIFACHWRAWTKYFIHKYLQDFINVADWFQ